MDNNNVIHIDMAKARNRNNAGIENYRHTLLAIISLYRKIWESFRSDVGDNEFLKLFFL